MKLVFTKHITRHDTYTCEFTKEEWDSIRDWMGRQEEVDCKACYNVIRDVSFSMLSKILHGIENAPSWMDTTGAEVFLDEFVMGLVSDSYELDAGFSNIEEEEVVFEEVD